jgi:hypothetical protein
MQNAERRTKRKALHAIAAQCVDGSEATRDRILELLDDGKEHMRVIEAIFAFVVTDDHGVEGVVRRATDDGTQPAISDSLERLEMFRPEAERVAGEMRMPLTIARFVRAKEIQ